MYRLNDYLIKHYQSCLRFTCELHNQTIDNLFAHRQNVNTHKTKSQKTLIRPHHLISRQVLCPRKYLRDAPSRFNKRNSFAAGGLQRPPSRVISGGDELRGSEEVSARGCWIFCANLGVGVGVSWNSEGFEMGEFCLEMMYVVMRGCWLKKESRL